MNKMKVKGDAHGERRPTSMTVFEELMQYYDDKISSLKRAREALEEAKPVMVPEKGEGARSRALLAMELVTELVDDMMMDVVFEAHFEAKQRQAVCASCHTRCQSKSAQRDAMGSPKAKSKAAVPSGAAGGVSPGLGSVEMFECPSCMRSFPGARFAAHMDKCMGLSSRRTTTRRSTVNSAASTPNYPAATQYESSSEQSNIDRKRKAMAARDAGRKKTSKRK